MQEDIRPAGSDIGGSDDAEGRGGGGLSLLSFTAAADCRGRMATSNKVDQQRFTAEPLLALMQRERASDLCHGRDRTFRRRVDGLLAKN
jgi:hypothetical protein